MRETGPDASPPLAMPLAVALALLAASLGGPLRPERPAGVHGVVRGTDPCQLASVDRRTTASARCLACHDGSAAPAVVRSTRVAAPLGDHQVDADYAQARLRRGFARLRDPRELGPALPLVDGKVACTTCHAGDSRERAHVALPMAGSALCFACHAM
jgi:predicted CXXCH cytochrome family protein